MASNDDQRWLRQFIAEQSRAHDAELVAGPAHLKYLRLTLPGHKRGSTYCYVTIRGYLDFRLPKSSARNCRHAFARDVQDDGSPYAVRLPLTPTPQWPRPCTSQPRGRSSGGEPVFQEDPRILSTSRRSWTIWKQTRSAPMPGTGRLAVMRSFNVPPSEGLSQQQASQAFKRNGYNPKSIGGWVRRGWIARDGDRRVSDGQRPPVGHRAKKPRHPQQGRRASSRHRMNRCPQGQRPLSPCPASWHPGTSGNRIASRTHNNGVEDPAVRIFTGNVEGRQVGGTFNTVHHDNGMPCGVWTVYPPVSLGRQPIHHDPSPQVTIP